MQEVLNMAWIKPEYSKNQIRRAGEAILNEDIPNLEWRKNNRIINNWRSSHTYPLYIISNKVKQIANGYDNSFVVTRLKRMDSIIGKLRRNPKMSLSGMQDLGGCRVVANNLDEVYRIANEYESSKIRHIMCREKDYIREPKISGYRCLHRVYKYQSDKPDSPYNNMFIEIQFRSHLQHLWATALETMGVYTKQNLKAGIGDEQYLRFFTLVSSLFALKEGTPVIPNTSNNKEELTDELIELNRKYKITEKLRTIQLINNAERRLSSEYPQIGWYLLLLDYKTLNITIRPFGISELKEANEQYAMTEQDSDLRDVVLVTAESYKQLKQAYPNYFMDISEFMGILQMECGLIDNV